MSRTKDRDEQVGRGAMIVVVEVMNWVVDAVEVVASCTIEVDVTEMVTD